LFARVSGTTLDMDRFMNGLLGGGLGLAGRLGFCSSELSTATDLEMGSNSLLFAAARLIGAGEYGSVS
jgi:hypothetical protein